MRIVQKCLMLMCLSLFSACGPAVYFHGHQLNGPSPIEVGDQVVYHYNIDFDAEPACGYVEGDCYDRYLREPDAVDVEQSLSLSSPSVIGFGSLYQMVATSANTGDMYFLFKPTEAGTYTFLVNTRVRVFDQGLVEDQTEQRPVTITVVPATTSPKLSISTTYSRLSDIGTSLSFQRIPSTGSELVLTNSILHSGDTAQNAVFATTTQGYFAMSYAGRIYKTPFHAQNARAYVALADADSDGVQEVYFQFTDVFDFLSSHPLQNYYKMVLVE